MKRTVGKVIEMATLEEIMDRLAASSARQAERKIVIDRIAANLKILQAAWPPHPSGVDGKGTAAITAEVLVDMSVLLAAISREL